MVGNCGASCGGYGGRLVVVFVELIDAVEMSPSVTGVELSELAILAVPKSVTPTAKSIGAEPV